MIPYRGPPKSELLRRLMVLVPRPGDVPASRWYTQQELMRVGGIRFSAQLFALVHEDPSLAYDCRPVNRAKGQFVYRLRQRREDESPPTTRRRKVTELLEENEKLLEENARLREALSAQGVAPADEKNGALPKRYLVYAKGPREAAMGFANSEAAKAAGKSPNDGEWTLRVRARYGGRCQTVTLVAGRPALRRKP